MTDGSDARPAACEEFALVADEFALGALAGIERARALAHLELCPGCRARTARLSATRDRLLELIPEAEPRAGFERLVMDRLPHPAPRFPRWAPVAAALLALALVGGGWVLGRSTAPTSAPAVAVAPAPTGRTLAIAPLTVDGRQVGQAFAYPGEPSFVYVSLDTGRHDETGPVTCLLQRPDGSTVPLGTFEMRRGYGRWGASAQLDGDALRAATLVVRDPAGTLVATARFT